MKGGYVLCTTHKNMRYKALALQTTCYAVNSCRDRTEATDRMLKTIAQLRGQIAASIGFIGRDVKVVVLPEYFLTGFPLGETLSQWRDKAALHYDDDAYKALGEIAQTFGIYLSGNAYEIDPHFPELYFQTSFIINTEGVVALRYRRLNSMFAPTPHDIFDAYLKVYDYNSLFPVLKTEWGNLACIASEEILYPELARCLAMRGAEIFLHHTSEVGSPLQTPKNVAKIARAVENMAYVVSANSARIEGTAIPAASTDGSSKVIDYRGIVLAEAGYGESMVANADIDIEGLRLYRSKPAMGNLLARQRFELYAPSYAQHSFYPPNNLPTQPDRSHFINTQIEVIKKLKDKGVF